MADEDALRAPEDSVKLDWQSVAAYLARQGMRLDDDPPPSVDPPADDGNIGKIAASGGINAVPESALIDRQGNIREYFVNKRDWQSPVAETCLRSVIDGN